MARDNNGHTPLHIAAACGRAEVVRVLIMKYNCPVDCVDSNRCTPLMAASIKGHTATVKMLASELGADVEARNCNKRTALHCAAGQGHKDVVSVLINELGCSPDSKGPNNKTPLHAACKEGQVDVVNFLVSEYKCNNMARDENGLTPLHVAAAHGREEIVRILITKYSSPINCVDNNGWTPLMAASYKGQAGAVIMLISELGANMEARDRSNLTALHLAVLGGHKNVVRVLVDGFGCSPRIRGPDSKTLLHAACPMGQVDMVSVLIDEYKCNMMARDDKKQTPLHTAAQCGRKEVVRVLITKYNCPVDCVDSHGFTPLMAASWRGHVFTIKLLASEFGADVERKDKNNLSSLHLAAFKGHMDVVSVLIEEFSCNPQSRGFGNLTPLHAACQGGHVDLVNKLIEKYNCDPMATNYVGHNSLHLAVLRYAEGVVKELVIKHGCSVDSISWEGNTPTHLAAYTGQVGAVKLLTDVFGAFPSIKNNQGNTPMDCNPIATLLSPQISTCFAYIHQCGIQQLRYPPSKVLLLGKSSGNLANLINLCSTYSLPHFHLKENTCFLNYVNADLQDVWMCQYSGRGAYNSMLVQTLMSGNLYTAVCFVDLDRATEQVVDEVHSQVALIEEVNANSREERTHIIICGFSSMKQPHLKNVNIMQEQVQRTIYGSTWVNTLKYIFLWLPTASPQEEIAPLINALKDNSKASSPKMRYGSVYLLKLLLRDFSDVSCITFTQLHNHLQDKRISSEHTQEDIQIFLKELDSLHYIIIVGNKMNPDNMIIIINPLIVMDRLQNVSSKSSNPLTKMGIVDIKVLSTLVPTPRATSIILSLLKRFKFPSTKFPLQKITLDKALKNTSDTFLFIPHIIAEPRQTRKWFLQYDNPFTIGLSLEVVEGFDLFSLEFQHSLLTKIAQHFIGLLDSNAELEGHVHNAVWQGGTMWALDDVGILAEVLDNRKCIVVIVRSSLYSSLKCISIVSLIGSIILRLKQNHCSRVFSKAFVVSPDALEKDAVPHATNVPRVEASSVLFAINNNHEYVTDSSGSKIGRQKVNWLQTFCLKGQILAVKHMEVCHILKQVSGKWRDIGKELGIPQKRLQTLQEANLPPELCCSKVVEEWLMYSGDEPSWYSLTEALRKLNMEQVVGKIMTKWGPHVEIESQLRVEDKREEAITDGFLSALAEIVKPHWDLLAPFIISTGYDPTENILQQLRAWKEEKSPTYGDLHESLNQLIINPPKDGRCQDEDNSSESGDKESEVDDIEALNDEEEDIEKMETAKQKELLDEALGSGHIRTGLDVLLFIGAAGSGKSHYKHLCLGLPPPEVRDSTGLSEHPVRTMSLVRGAQNRKLSSLQWHEVSPKEFKELIIEAIRKGEYEKLSALAMMAKLAEQATERLPTLDMEHSPADAERMSSMQRESAAHDWSVTPEIEQVASQNTISTPREWPSSACVHYESNFYEDLLKISSTEPQKKRGKLMDVDWIYIVDSGGQPQFREMLPVLVQMATACVLALKLNEPLGELNEVKFYQEGRELCKPYLSVLTNEQIVKHCSQIVGSQTKNCKLFVVGTHRDLEHDHLRESRAEKNERLLKILQSQLGSNLEVYKIGDSAELIYPVNGKTPEDEDYRVVEQFRMAVHNIARSKEKVDIPLYWFLLELLLHELAAESGILNFEGCKEQAICQLRFSEQAFSTAVKFLAQRLGTIMYFPQALPTLIFTPQALMSILSEIVKLRHLLNDSQQLPPECQGYSGEWIEFQQRGIMTTNLLLRAPLKKFFSDMFTPNDFLIVMKKLLIVASITDSAFFFPSVLEELTSEGVQQQVAKSRDCLAPLVLHCSDSAVRGCTKENWLRVGSFTSLVARLLNVNKWTLHTNQMQKPTCLYRNCIQFTLPDNQPGIVTLVDQFKHMEVYLQVDPETAKRVSKVVVPTLYSGLQEVHKCLLHCENKIEIAFLCPQHNGFHTASIARSDRGQWKWICKQDRITSGKVTEKQRSWLNIYGYIQDQDHSTSEELSEKQKPWLEDHNEDTSPKLHDLMNEVAAKVPATRWKAFASQLHLEYECIRQIQRENAGNVSDIFMAVFHEWRMQRTTPYTWETIVSALRSDCLKEMRLAEGLAEKFLYC